MLAIWPTKPREQINCIAVQWKQELEDFHSHYETTESKQKDVKDKTCKHHALKNTKVDLAQVACIHILCQHVCVPFRLAQTFWHIFSIKVTSSLPLCSNNNTGLYVAMAWTVFLNYSTDCSENLRARGCCESPGGSTGNCSCCVKCLFFSLSLFTFDPWAHTFRSFQALSYLWESSARLLLITRAEPTLTARRGDKTHRSRL